MDVLALSHCLQPHLSPTNLRRMSRGIQAILSLSGRVTMLNISRWAGPGGNYRTIQRFFNAELPWRQVFG